MTTKDLSAALQERAVLLPTEVDAFLVSLSECYGKRDVSGIMDNVSDRFLYQGMDKASFQRCLEESYVLNRVTNLRLVPIQFRQEGDNADIVAIAEANLGVLPAAEPSLPFIEGSKIVLEKGKWRLYGNQSKATQGLYRDFYQLSVFFRPANIHLYRSLLPSCFEVPSEPMVFVKAAANLRLRAPLGPYKMAHVQILARWEGLSAWYTLTMPETDWLPVEMGNTIGYPKYIADTIRLEASQDRCTAAVVNDGSTLLSVEFHHDSAQASWFERTTSEYPLSLARKLLPPFREKPWFLLMAPEERPVGGHTLLLAGSPILTGLPRVREIFGSASLVFHPSCPWQGLLPTPAEMRGILMYFSGQLMLRHSLHAQLSQS
jgi:hypothetical protein